MKVAPAYSYAPEVAVKNAPSEMGGQELAVGNAAAFLGARLRSRHGLMLTIRAARQPIGSGVASARAIQYSIEDPKKAMRISEKVFSA